MAILNATLQVGDLFLQLRESLMGRLGVVKSAGTQACKDAKCGTESDLFHDLQSS